MTERRAGPGQRRRGWVVPALAAVMLLAVAGCGGTPPSTDGAPASQESTHEFADVRVRATTLPTMMLGEAVAREYGIERRDGLVMLLVGARRGDEAAEVSAPARISVTTTDLRGQRQRVEMRELHSGELVDHVGTLPVEAPETLRFEVEIALADGTRSTMRFNRDFLPR